MIKDGLISAGGIISDAAKFLSQKYNRPCARSTVYAALQADPTLKEVAKQCEGVTFDVCMRGIVKRAESGNARDQRVLFMRLAANHGIPNVQKIEMTGADGKPIQHEVTADGELTNTEIDALSDEELQVVIAAERIKHAKRLASVSKTAGA